MIIGEERCPGVYGKWAHANQCRTDLEGALGCLIYCLSTSLGKKKIEKREEKGEERRKGKGGQNTKALVPEALSSAGNTADMCSQACSAPLSPPRACLCCSPGLSVAGGSGRSGQLSIPHLSGPPKSLVRRRAG